VRSERTTLLSELIRTVHLGGEIGRYYEYEYEYEYDYENENENENENETRAILKP
jgi:hypothetical protein